MFVEKTFKILRKSPSKYFKTIPKRFRNSDCKNGNGNGNKGNKFCKKLGNRKSIPGIKIRKDFFKVSDFINALNNEPSWHKIIDFQNNFKDAQMQSSREKLDTCRDLNKLMKDLKEMSDKGKSRNSSRLAVRDLNNSKQLFHTQTTLLKDTNNDHRMKRITMNLFTLDISGVKTTGEINTINVQQKQPFAPNKTSNNQMFNDFFKSFSCTSEMTNSAIEKLKVDENFNDIVTIHTSQIFPSFRRHDTYNSNDLNSELLLYTSNSNSDSSSSRGQPTMLNKSNEKTPENNTFQTKSDPKSIELDVRLDKELNFFSPHEDDFPACFSDESQFSSLNPGRKPDNKQPNSAESKTNELKKQEISLPQQVVSLDSNEKQLEAKLDKPPNKKDIKLENINLTGSIQIQKNLNTIDGLVNPTFEQLLQFNEKLMFKHRGVSESPVNFDDSSKVSKLSEFIGSVTISPEDPKELKSSKLNEMYTLQNVTSEFKKCNYSESAENITNFIDKINENLLAKVEVTSKDSSLINSNLPKFAETENNLIQEPEKSSDSCKDLLGFNEAIFRKSPETTSNFVDKVNKNLLADVKATSKDNKELLEPKEIPNLSLTNFNLPKFAETENKNPMEEPGIGSDSSVLKSNLPKFTETGFLKSNEKILPITFREKENLQKNLNQKELEVKKSEVVMEKFSEEAPVHTTPIAQMPIISPIANISQPLPPPLQIVPQFLAVQLQYISQHPYQMKNVDYSSGQNSGKVPTFPNQLQESQTKDSNIDISASAPTFQTFPNIQKSNESILSNPAKPEFLVTQSNENEGAPNNPKPNLVYTDESENSVPKSPKILLTRQPKLKLETSNIQATQISSESTTTKNDNKPTVDTSVADQRVDPQKRIPSKEAVPEVQTPKVDPSIQPTIGTSPEQLGTSPDAVANKSYSEADLVELGPILEGRPPILNIQQSNKTNVSEPIKTDQNENRLPAESHATKIIKNMPKQTGPLQVEKSEELSGSNQNNLMAEKLQEIAKNQIYESQKKEDSSVQSNQSTNKATQNSIQETIMTATSNSSSLNTPPNNTSPVSTPNINQIEPKIIENKSDANPEKEVVVESKQAEEKVASPEPSFPQPPTKQPQLSTNQFEISKELKPEEERAIEARFLFEKLQAEETKPVKPPQPPEEKRRVKPEFSLEQEVNLFPETFQKQQLERKPMSEPNVEQHEIPEIPEEPKKEKLVLVQTENIFPLFVEKKLIDETLEAKKANAKGKQKNVYSTKNKNKPFNNDFKPFSIFRAFWKEASMKNNSSENNKALLRFQEMVNKNLFTSFKPEKMERGSGNSFKSTSNLNEPPNEPAMKEYNGPRKPLTIQQKPSLFCRIKQYVYSTEDLSKKNW